MAIEPDLVAELAVALREEITRQYRDDDRKKCRVGIQFWEENVQPMLLAEVAMRFIQRRERGMNRRDIARIINQHSVDTVEMHGRINASHQAVQCYDEAYKKADTILQLEAANADQEQISQSLLGLPQGCRDQH